MTLDEAILHAEDAVSRRVVKEQMIKYGFRAPDMTVTEFVEDELPSVQPMRKQEPKAEQFAKWVATEIFDDLWEYNKDSFAEIACRKLAELGIVRAKGDEWELVETQESEDKE